MWELNMKKSTLQVRLNRRVTSDHQIQNCSKVVNDFGKVFFDFDDDHPQVTTSIN